MDEKGETPTGQSLLRRNRRTGSSNKKRVASFTTEDLDIFAAAISTEGAESDGAPIQLKHSGHEDTFAVFPLDEPAHCKTDSAYDSCSEDQQTSPPIHIKTINHTPSGQDETDGKDIAASTLPPATIDHSPKHPMARLCHLKIWPDFRGYGFNLESKRNCFAESRISQVEEGSPAAAAGLRPRDKVIAVNEESIAQLTHPEIVAKIKASPSEAKLLVVDREAEEYFSSNSLNPCTQPAYIHTIVCPDTNPMGYQHTARFCHIYDHNNSGFGFTLSSIVNTGILFIGAVKPDSAAHSAGIRTGDKLLEVNGKSVSGADLATATKLIRAVPKETHLLVVDESADWYFKRLDVRVDSSMPFVEHRTSTRPGSRVSVGLTEKGRPNSARLCRLSVLTNKRQSFGFRIGTSKDKSVQCIQAVDPGSLAESVGLKAGDRIIEVNGVAVRGMDHQKVVELIKTKEGETTLLVLDGEAEKQFKNINIPAQSSIASTVKMCSSEPRSEGDNVSCKDETSKESGDTVCVQKILCESEDEDSEYTKAKFVAMEILTSEKGYVQRLYLLDQVFHARVLEANREHRIIPSRDIPRMFPQVKSIFQLHNDFLLPELEKCIQNWLAGEMIGTIMVKFVPFLKLYPQYVRTMEPAKNLISSWRKRSQKFRSLLEQIEKLPVCDELPLSSHMMEPVQRIPRYEMLLERYMKSLPTSACDYADTQVALKMVKETANIANQALHKLGEFQTLVDIAEIIDTAGINVVSRHRAFVRKSDFLAVCDASGKTLGTEAFLFTDMLMICENGKYTIKTRKQKKCKMVLEFEGLKVTEGDSALVLCVSNEEKLIKMHCRSEQEKEQWHQDLAGLLNASSEA